MVNKPSHDGAGRDVVAGAYSGPHYAVFCGRPFALKRSFQNLIDNAVRYGERCEAMQRTPRWDACSRPAYNVDLRWL
jgi:hypothetical protein